jgi:hypothetical protein
LTRLPRIGTSMDSLASLFSDAGGALLPRQGSAGAHLMVFRAAETSGNDQSRRVRRRDPLPYAPYMENSPPSNHPEKTRRRTKIPEFAGTTNCDKRSINP